MSYIHTFVLTNGNSEIRSVPAKLKGWEIVIHTDRDLAACLFRYRTVAIKDGMVYKVSAHVNELDLFTTGEGRATVYIEVGEVTLKVHNKSHQEIIDLCLQNLALEVSSE